MKNKIWILLLAVTMVFSCSIAIYAAEDDLEILPAGGYKIGDVNKDKDINIKDATLVQKYIAQLEELSSDQRILADNDFDGEVTIKDATYIQKYVAGLVPPATPDVPVITTVTETSGITTVQITTEEVVTTVMETTNLTDPEETTEADTQPLTSQATEPQETTQLTDPTEAPVTTTQAPETTVTDPVETVEPTTKDKNKPIELPFVPAR